MTAYDELELDTLGDKQAQHLLDTMIPAMAKAAGATEQLKATDQMKWVGLIKCGQGTGGGNYFCKADLRLIQKGMDCYVDI